MGHLTKQATALKTIPPKQGTFFRKKDSTPYFIQPKLSINQPNDPYEQEADAMADRVMRMPDQESTSQPFFRPRGSSLQRKCAHCEEEEKNLQRKAVNSREPATNNQLESYVGRLNSGGQALPDEVRDFFEPRFGYDFSQVKVHTDTVAAKSAQSIDALAYTSGNNIVFNNNQYSPGTDRGKRLLGHELTHVVQQEGAVVAKVQAQKEDEGVSDLPNYSTSILDRIIGNLDQSLEQVDGESADQIIEAKESLLSFVNNGSAEQKSILIDQIITLSQNIDLSDPQNPDSLLENGNSLQNETTIQRMAQAAAIPLVAAGPIGWAALAVVGVGVLVYAASQSKPCPPCPAPPPPEIDRVPPSRPHFPCPGDHWHYYEYNQNPVRCHCYGPRRLFGGCCGMGMPGAPC